MDSLMSREKASSAAIYAMGAPAPRMSYANVFINGKSWGVYLILEEAGTNQYLHSRFGAADGALFKVTGGATLKYLGDDPDLYRNDTAHYKAMNDAAEESFAPLAKFIEIVNLPSIEEFEEQIQAIMNVEFFFRTFVAEVATGNWDGSFNGNNYFLYYNTDNLFYYYRYDLDVSMGIYEEWFNSSQKNVWEWGRLGFGFRLLNRMLSVPSFQPLYSSYLTKVSSYVTADPGSTYLQRMREIHAEIKPAVRSDLWHQLDSNMGSFEEFERNFDHPIFRPNVLPPQQFLTGQPFVPALSIIQFLTDRVASTNRQLKDGPPPS